jgi:hypothetical protein
VTPTADLVGYRQIPRWLNQDELAELINEIRSILVPKIDNKPAPDRSLHCCARSCSRSRNRYRTPATTRA